MTDKYISKIDSTKSKGYLLRLPPIKNGVISKIKTLKTTYYSKSKYKTWKAARQAAINKRDAYLKDNNALSFLDSIQQQKPRQHYFSNSSGVIGVAKVVSCKNGVEYYHYRAAFTINGKQYKKAFSINKYTECGAFIMACRVRFQYCGTLSIVDKDKLPCLPDVKYIINSQLS